MSILELQGIKYSDYKRELTYEFNKGNLYALYCESPEDDELETLFKIMTYLVLADRGTYFWENINIKKLTPSLYRSNMISVISEKNTCFDEMKTLNFLKYSTDNFQKLDIQNIEFVDYLELIYGLAEEWGIDEKKMNTKIKKLNNQDKWQVKLIESLLKGSNVLLINKTLDYYDNEQLDFFFQSLNQMAKKYNQCIIVFTEKKEIAYKLDYLINI